MADIPIGTLRARLGVDTRQFDRQMRGVQRRLRAQSRQFRQTGQTLSRSLTLPIVLAGAAITAAAVNFDREMRRVKALTGATGEQFKALENQAKTLGRTTAFSATQAAEGMGFLAQAGFEVNKILQTLPGTLSLAAAGQVELARAADIASNVLMAFRLEASEMGRVGDTLAATFSSSNVNLEQLAEAMKMVAPTANSLGHSVEETAAAIGLLGDAGLQGTIAGTSLNQAFLKMLDVSPKAARAARLLGVELRDQRGELLPLVDILGQLEQAAAGAEEVMAIFGVRGGRAINTLVGRSAELRQFTADLAAAGGTADRLAKEQLEGLYGALVRLKSATEGAALALADAGLSDLVMTVSRGLTRLSQSIADSDDASRRSAVGIALLAAAIPPLLIVLGSLGAALTPIVVALVALAPLIGAAGSIAIGFGILTTAVYGGAVAWEKLNRAMKEGATVAADVGEQFRILVPDMQEVAARAAETLSYIEAMVSFQEIEAQISRMGAAGVGPVDPEAMLELLERRERLQGRLQEISDEIGPLELGVSIKLSVEEMGGVPEEVDEATRHIIAALAEMEEEMELASWKAEVFGESFDLASEQASILEDAVVSLLKEGIKPSTPAIQKMAAELRELTDEATRGEALEEIGKLIEQAEERARLFDVDPLIAEMDRGTAAIRAFAEAGAISELEAEKAIKRWADAFRMIREGTERAAEIAKQKAAAEDLQRQLEQPFLNAAENIQREFGNLFTDLFRGGVDSFEDLADTVKDIWARLAGEMVAMALFQPQAFFGGGGAVAAGGGAAGMLGLGGQLSGWVTDLTGTIANLFQSETRKLQRQNIQYQEEAASYATQLGMPVSGVGAGWTGGSGLMGRLGGAQGILSMAGAAIAGGFTGYLIGREVGQNPAEKIGWTVGGFIGSAIGTYFTKGMGGSSGIGQLFTLAGGYILSSIMGMWYDVIQGEVPLGTRQKWRNVSRAMFMDPTLMLLAQIGVFEPPPIKAQLATRPAGADLAEFQKRYAQVSPFGMVGLYGPGTQEVAFQSMAGLTTQIREIDEMVAKYMTDVQVSRVAQALQTTTAFQAKSKTDISDKIFNVIADRLNVIFTALIGPETKMTHTGLHLQAQLTSLLDDLKAGNQANIGVLLERVQEFLAARAELSNMLDYIVREATVGISEGEKAVEQLAAQFDQLAEQAKALGIAEERVAEARDAALSALRREFAENIQDKILALTDTFMLSVVQMQRAQEERLASARALGADLVEVERLNMLERQKLLEDFNKPIETFLEDLRTGIGSPFAPSVIEEAAEERFRALASQVSAGEFVDPSVLVDAAQAFLDASRMMYASSAAFFEAVELVEEVLTQARATELPGFQAGGSFTIPGGGYDNVVPLFRVSGGERIDVTSRTGAIAEDRLLRGIGEAIEEGNAAARADGRELRDRVERMAVAIEKNQAAITRLANKKSA